MMDDVVPDVPQSLVMDRERCRLAVYSPPLAAPDQILQLIATVRAHSDTPGEKLVHPSSRRGVNPVHVWSLVAA